MIFHNVPRWIEFSNRMHKNFQRFSLIIDDTLKYDIGTVDLRFQMALQLPGKLNPSFHFAQG